MDKPHTPHRRLVTAMAILLAVALLGVAPCLTIDGKSYYMQLRSIVYGGDANYYDEMLYHHELYESVKYVTDALPTGYVPNVFPLGFAVILTPFFLLGHGITLVMQAVGWGIPPNGYSFPEVLFTLMASAGLGSIGILLSSVIAGRMYGIKAAFWATLVLWLASPLPVYIYGQPSFAHSISLAASALVLLIWLQGKHDNIIKRGLVLGLAIGLAALIRWQDGVYLLLPLCDMIRFGRRWGFGKSFRYVMIVGFGVIVAILPQLVLWKIIYGSWITIPQGQEFMRWGNPEILSVLFGARHGLVSWTPVMAISIIGMIWMAIRKFAVGIPILLVLIVQVYVNSVAWDWWAGWGFGARRFLDMIPFFILATAFLINELPRVVRKVIPFLFGGLILWNVSLIYHYLTGHVTYGGDVFFTDWCRVNWKLLYHQPFIALSGIAFFAVALWMIQRWAISRKKSNYSSAPQWLPPTWLIVVTIIYLAAWTMNLARTTIGIERLQVLNDEAHYRQWITVAYHPPFQGSRLDDTVAPGAPWQQLAPWDVKPGGDWKLVTACAGELEHGETAAVLLVVSIDDRKWEQSMLWDQATGPMEIEVQSLAKEQSTAPIARIDLPPKFKTLPYRTFKPLPMYLWRWLKFAADYSNGRIPLHAAYEHTFTLPDNFTPKRFEIHLKEAVKCNIYGIGKVLDR